MIRGMWAGRALQADPAKLVRKAQRAKLNAVCLIANDASKQYTGAASWSPYDSKRFQAASDALRAAELRVEVMTWLVADEEYIDAMAGWLFDHRPAFDRVQLDVEEAWIMRSPTGIGSMAKPSRTSLAQNALAPAMSGVGAPVAATAIMHTDFARVQPIDAIVSAWIPQVYCTTAAATKWGVDPMRSPGRCADKYRDNLPGKPLELAGAAYDTTPAHLKAAASASLAAGSAGLWWWYLDGASDLLLDAIAQVPT